MKPIILIILICFTASVNSNAQNQVVKQYDLWRFENYITAEGYIIGIWPHEARIVNLSEAVKLKNILGFSHIYLNVNHSEETFKMLNAAGYPSNKIMVSISPENFRDRIKQFPGAYAYYIDEPNERDLSIEGMKEFISTNSSGSLFIISGYRRTNAFIELTDKSDGVMFSSYKHWWECFPNVWCPWPVNYDQRSDWTDMKERFNVKSFTNWVGAHRDTLDYYDLLAHASDLKLKGVWLYQLEDPSNSEKNLQQFSDAAWNAGFMRKFERRFIYEYKLTEVPEPRWELHRIVPTDEIREVFPDKKLK